MKTKNISDSFLLTILIVQLIFFVSIDAFAQTKAVDNPVLSFYEEGEHELSLKEILSAGSAILFQKISGQTLNLGYRAHAVWIKLELPTERLTHNDHWILNIRNFKLNRIQLFYQSVDRGWQQQNDGIKEYEQHRNKIDREYTFQITNLMDGAPVFLRVEAYYYRIPVRLLPFEAFDTAEKSSILFDGLFYGLALAIILYHLFLFLAIRNRAYLSYAVFLTIAALMFLSGQGWMYAFLFSHLPEPFFNFAHGTSPFAGWLLLISGVQFTKDYLTLADYATRFNKVFSRLQLFIIGYGLVGIILIAGNLIGIFAIFYNTGFLLVVLTIMLCFYSVYLGIRHQQVTARYYLMATSLQFVVSIVMILSLYQLIPLEFGWKILQTSLIIEMMIFSFGLSRQVKKIETDKQEITAELLNARQQMIDQLETINQLKDKVLSKIMDSRLYPEFAKLFSVMNKITYIQEIGNFSKLVYLDEGIESDLEIEASLKDIETYFDETVFVRIHKTYLVKPAQNLSLLRRSTADYDLISPHFVLPVGRKYLALVRDRLLSKY